MIINTINCTLGHLGTRVVIDLLYLNGSLSQRRKSDFEMAIQSGRIYSNHLAQFGTELPAARIVKEETNLLGEWLVGSGSGQTQQAARAWAVLPSHG